MLIAVSSFGKGLRWEFLTEPAEAIFNLRQTAFQFKPFQRYISCSVTGSTTVNVEPCPTTESTQMRP
jgi:hypothetical protein